MTYHIKYQYHKILKTVIKDDNYQYKRQNCPLILYKQIKINTTYDYDYK